MNLPPTGKFRGRRVKLRGIEKRLSRDELPLVEVTLESGEVVRPWRMNMHAPVFTYADDGVLKI